MIVQLGHSGEIETVALSPEGRRVLTGGWDHTAKLWDADTGKELRSFVGHSAGVVSVAFSPDGRRILTGSKDHTAKLWDAETGQELRSFRAEGFVESAVFSRDGHRVLTGDTMGTAKLWDAATGRELRSSWCHSVGSGVSFSPDGRHLVLANWEEAALCDAETGTKVRSFRGHSAKGVESVAFSPDGRRVLTGSDDHTAKLWDAETGKELRSFVGHSARVDSVAFSPDGRRVVTGGFDHSAKLWDAETGQELRSFTGHTYPVESVVFSRDGHRLLTGSWDRTAKLWDVETGKELRSFVGHTDSVDSVVFSRDGHRVLTGNGDNTAKLWDLETGKELRSFTGHTGAVRSVAISPDRRRILTGSEDRLAKLWDADTGKELRSFSGHLDTVESVVFSPDSRYVLTGSSDKTARVWDAETGKELRSFTGHSQSIWGLAISPDGRRVVTGSRDGTVRLWDANTGTESLRFTGPSSPLAQVAFSPDGRHVLTGGELATLWDVGTGKEIRSFRGHSDLVFSVAFSPDGLRVLTGSWDGTAKLWDAQTGKELHSFRGHSSFVMSVAFSPDGRRALTGSRDHTAKVWDVERGNCLATLVSFKDGTWAVVDPAARFDASNDGKVEGLHWAMGDTPIALSQLSERYYEPGLLAKAMGFNQEPLRPVERLENPRLFPVVELAPLAPGATALKIHLKNQGGGIGRVQVLVNGKEVKADARGPAIDPNAAEAFLEAQLVGAAAVRPGQENRVEVIAWNAEGHLASRGFQVLWRAPGEKHVEPPEIFAIVGGVSRYGSPSMNLTFAGKDALDMATAIRVSASRLFGAQKVHLTLLTDYPGVQDAQPPTRANLEKAFAAARRAKQEDVLIVYLAGHGTTAPDGEYWYLTREARTTDLGDPEVRKMSGVSSKDLTDWIKAVPVTKQVMVLDTCAAGAAAARLTEVRALSSDQIRAIARLKDRTGLHVLMGSSANAASYEASQYGQGLLTYALLEGMRGAALRDGEYVDVAKLFGHATEEVPRLARSIGGIQSPIISAPSGASFDIGQLTAQDKRLVPLAMVRPMILRSSFQRQEPPFDDRLDLSKGVNAALRDAADPAARGGKIAFVDGDELPDAIRLTGRYLQSGDSVRVDSYLLDGQKVHAHFTVSGRASDLKGLAQALVQKAQEAMPRK